MTDHFVVPEPLRSPWLTYVYLGVGLGIAITGFSSMDWDVVRGYIVIVTFTAAILSAQVALVYGNAVFPRLPVHQRDIVNTPSAYYMKALGMLLLGTGIILNFVARAGEAPSSPLGLVLIGVGMSVLAAWNLAVLRAFHRISQDLDG